MKTIAYCLSFILLFPSLYSCTVDSLQENIEIQEFNLEFLLSNDSINKLRTLNEKRVSNLISSTNRNSSFDPDRFVELLQIENKTQYEIKEFQDILNIMGFDDENKYQDYQNTFYDVIFSISQTNFIELSETEQYAILLSYQEYFNIPQRSCQAIYQACVNQATTILNQSIILCGIATGVIGAGIGTGVLLAFCIAAAIDVNASADALCLAEFQQCQNTQL